MRSPLAKLAAAGLLLGACSYDFTNPAEKLQTGEVTGRVLADLSGNGDLQAVAGAEVAIRNSTNVQTTRDNGRFFLLGLVPGRHTLLMTKGTAWALQRDIEVGFGSDGQIEGVVLGDIRLRYSVTLGGTITPPAGTTLDPFPITPPTAIVFDESTGRQVSATPEWDGVNGYSGRFFFTFPGSPVGPHRFRFALAAERLFEDFLSSWVGGPVTQTIPDTSEGQSLTLAPAPLRDPNTLDTGKLRFRAVPSLGAPSFDVLITSVATGLTIGDGTAGNPYPAPDSTGWVEVDVPEGIYSVSLYLPSPGTFEAPLALEAIVIANQTTELGSLYIVDTTDVDAAGRACLKSADCFSLEVCTDGQCVFHEPSTQVPNCVYGGPVDLDCAQLCVIAPPYGATPCGPGGLGLCAETTGGAPVRVCIPPSPTSQCIYQPTGETVSVPAVCTP